MRSSAAGFVDRDARDPRGDVGADGGERDARQPLLWPLYVFATLSAGLYTFNRPAMSTWPARLLPPELLPSSNALEAGFGTRRGDGGPGASPGILILTIEPAGAFVVRRRDVPRRDRVRVADEAVAARARGRVGELGRDRGRVPVPQGQAHDPVGVRGRPDRDDLRVPDGAVPGDRGEARAADPVPASSVCCTRRPRSGAFLATAFSGRAKHVRRQGRAIMIGVVVWGAAIVVFGLSTRLWLSLAMLDVAGRRRHGERHLPDDDPAGRGRRLDAGAARRHRDGRVGDRTVVGRRGVGRRRLDLERAGERGVGRPAHHRRCGRAPAARAGVRPVRRATPVA